MTEDQLSALIFQTAWNKYPQTRRLFFHVKNEGLKNIRTAQRDKATGLVKGVPDYVFGWNGKMYGFEIKTEIGVLSKAQKELHQVWNDQDIPVYIIRSLEEFECKLVKILEQVLEKENY